MERDRERLGFLVALSFRVSSEGFLQGKIRVWEQK